MLQGGHDTDRHVRTACWHGAARRGMVRARSIECESEDSSVGLSGAKQQKNNIFFQTSNAESGNYTGLLRSLFVKRSFTPYNKGLIPKLLCTFLKTTFTKELNRLRLRKNY